MAILVSQREVASRRPVFDHDDPVDWKRIDFEKAVEGPLEKILATAARHHGGDPRNEVVSGLDLIDSNYRVVLGCSVDPQPPLRDRVLVHNIRNPGLESQPLALT